MLQETLSSEVGGRKNVRNRGHEKIAVWARSRGQSRQRGLEDKEKKKAAGKDGLWARLCGWREARERRCCVVWGALEMDGRHAV